MGEIAHIVPALVLHAWRGALGMKWRILAVCLIAASGFAVTAGVYSAIDSLQLSRREAYHRGNLADLELLFEPLAAAQLPRFDDIAGVAEAEARLLAPGSVILASGRQLAALVIVVDATRPRRIHRLSIRDGQPLDPAHPSEVLVEHHLAESHGVGVGEILELAFEGRRQRLRVRGVAESAEFLVPPANPNLFIPAKSSLGVVYVSAGLVEAGLDARPVNSLLLTVAPRSDAEKLLPEILERAAERLTVVEAVSRRERFSVRFLELSFAVLRSFLPAVALVFTLTAFPVILFLSTQWITGQRREIGTAMSLGYGTRRLSLAYLCPAALVITGAIGFGIPLAALCLRTFAVSYAQALGLPRPTLWLAPDNLGWAALGVVVTVALAVAGPHSGLLRLRPVEALREPDRLPGTHLGPLAGVLNRLSGKLALRYASRNLLRTKMVSAMTVVAVGLSLGLVIAFSICQSSFEAAAQRHFRDDPWNVLVTFHRPASLAELDFDRLPGVREVIPYGRGVVRLVAAGGQRNVVLSGIPPRSVERGPRIVAGRHLASSDGDGVVLESHLATELGLAVGEPVVLERGGRRYGARVVGIRAGALLPGETYVTLAFGQKVLGLGERVSGAFVAAAGKPEEIKRQVYALPAVAQVLLTEEVYREVLASSAHIRALIRAAAGLSVPLAILFIFASFAYTILRRKREYVMLRILGFSDRMVATVIAAEVLLLGWATAAVAVPVGWGGASFLNGRLAGAWITIDTVASFQDFVVVLAPALLLLPLSALPVIRVVVKEPLS